MFNLSTFSKDVGGARAISWKPIAALAPMTIITVTFIESRYFTLSQISGWLTSTAIGYSAFCLVIYLAHLSLFRNRALQPVPIWSVFALGLVAGVIKGVTTGNLSYLFDLSTELQLVVWRHVVLAGLSGFLVLPGAALVMSSIDRFRQLRSELIAELMRIETQRMVNENMIPALKLQLRQTISKNLADLTQDFRASITAQQGTIANWQEIASDLRESAAGSVRSISHNLWGQKQLKSFPDLTPFEIARVLVSTFIQRKEVVAELESKIEASKIQALTTEQLTLRFSKDMAKYLHGNLQSRLMATAIAIETAGTISDDVELAAQLEVARQAIAAPFDHFFESVPKSLTAEITKLIDSWDTLLLTSLVFSGNDEQFSINEIRAILLCTEEGLANALHHGHASEVAINIATTQGMHAISLVDNGIGPRAGDPGLGSSLFNSIAGSNWSLSRGPAGIGAKLNLQINK